MSEQPEQPEPMATGPQVEAYIARALAVNPRTVNRWMRHGDGPDHSLTPGRHRRYQWADVYRWEEELRERTRNALRP